MTAQGQSIGISIGMLPQTLIKSITVELNRNETAHGDAREGK